MGKENNKNKNEGTIFVLFGATGDLAKKKLIPSLMHMYKAGDKMPILAVSRRDYTTKDYIDFINIDMEKGFDRQIEYFKTDFTDDPKRLKEKLKEIERKKGVKCRYLFYLAVPPELYEPITDYLTASKVLNGRERIIYEKPFGHSLKSAQSLNRCILDNFREEQVYRIDHYLAKELVQKILIFRFANSLFEHMWNSEFIDNVQIIISEDQGVGTRAGYYDKSGATRDMLQSHLLQVMSLVAMEQPKSFDASSIRDKKIEVFKNIRLYDYILGQYSEGKSGTDKKAKRLAGYLEEKGIPKDSVTDTFVAAKIFVNSERWKGVPFYLMTGKRLKKRFAEVNITLKISKCNLFPKEHSNIITINIQPDEGIKLRFNGKEAGTMNLTDAVMDYNHKCRTNENTPEAYEKLIREALKGDQTLFTRWDEVEETWKISDRITKARNGVFTYPAGSIPIEAIEFLKKDGRNIIS